LLDLLLTTEAISEKLSYSDAAIFNMPSNAGLAAHGATSHFMAQPHV
jgi:hypothetical protein